MKEIDAVTNYIMFYIENRYSNELIDEKLFKELCCYIADSLSYWSGNTNVGCKKDKSEEKIYQEFYDGLSILIDYLSDNEDKLMQIEKEFIKSIKYNGKVYRYLGYADPLKCKKKINPIFNDIWVSWSKEKYNSYLESKLYGKKTRLYCDIKDGYYGIDLENFQKYCEKVLCKECYISRGKESEVVFPTIKELIYNVEYIE